LRQQDALLIGAIALLVVLATVMYVTRKVDCYARDAG
jgi:inner membrane protein involved in colicin E2 resistance